MNRALSSSPITPSQRKVQPPVTHFDPIDLSRDWKVTFDKTGVSETMQTLHSWADDEPEQILLRHGDI